MKNQCNYAGPRRGARRVAGGQREARNPRYAIHQRLHPRGVQGIPASLWGADKTLEPLPGVARFALTPGNLPCTPPGCCTRGFTLIEMMVTLAIIVLLAAILTPIVTNYVDEARIVRAHLEAQKIADAILNFNKNTGKWAIFQSGVNITTLSAIYTTLAGPGADPVCSGCSSTWLSVNRGSLASILETNAPSYTVQGKYAWRGPYISQIGTDPWGNAYLVNAASLAFGVNRAAFVLSAGPNGAVETTFTQNIGSGSSAVTVGGDDIIGRIR
jgi:prepilin-type N-terminal cleavage/methylation domain-containing protein